MGLDTATLENIDNLYKQVRPNNDTYRNSSGEVKFQCCHNNVFLGHDSNCPGNKWIELGKALRKLKE